MEATDVKVPTSITVNPILKKDPHHQGSSPSKDDEQQQPAEKKHLKWDEQAIEEHDLLRGTRMKIDEPNTPYTHYDHASDDDASHGSGHHPRSPDENHPEHAKTACIATNFDDISSKLQAVADKREAAPLSPAPSRDSNMSDSEQEEARKKEHDKFVNHRKKHYNEAEAMRRWRAEHANDEDEDDEEEEDGDKMEE